MKEITIGSYIRLKKTPTQIYKVLILIVKVNQ